MASGAREVTGLSDRAYGCIVGVLVSALLWLALWRAVEWIMDYATG
jgi:hypothetical protein